MTDVDDVIQAIEKLNHAGVEWINTAYEEDGFVEFELEGVLIEPGHPQYEADGHDGGVAASGGWVCQNEPEHDGGGEVDMRGGPFNGVQCPECGRMTAHPDTEIPYSDPPHNE